MQCSSSCSSGCGGHVVACPCPEGGNPDLDSLEKVVNCFWQNHQELAAERAYFEGLGSLSLAIDEAAEALGDENLGYDRPDAIPAVVLNEARARLARAESDLACAAGFEPLHERVREALDGLEGISPGLVYLTALRIGLQAGLHPERIYLDDGAREGSAALVDLGADQSCLSRERLPRIFQHPELSTADVQSCLTICRHQLRWLSSNRPISAMHPARTG